MSEQPPTTLNYCGKCGASVQSDVKYCQNCGASISLSDTPQDHIRRMIDLGPVAGLHLYSLIQAAAMGYLFVVVRGQLDKLTEGTLGQIYAILILASFLVIIIIWNETVMATQSFRFPQNFWQVVLPFFVGMAQFLLIMSIDLQNVAWWYFSLSSVTLVSFFIFFNVYNQARLFYEFNSVTLEKLGESPLTTEIQILGVTLIYFCFGVLESIWKLNSLYIAIVTLVMIIAWMVRGNLYWRKIIKR